MRNYFLMVFKKFVEGKLIERFNNWREVAVITALEGFHKYCLDEILGEKRLRLWCKFVEM